jgi:predicted AAA+ superfamily ATPase
MAISNYERVGKAMELLKAGLGPFVDREFQSAMAQKKVTAELLAPFMQDPKIGNKPPSEWDVAALLKMMWDTWNVIFKTTLGFAERNLVSELRNHRNAWAHQESFSSDEAYRVFDSAGRLLTAVSAPEAVEVEKMKMELLRLRFDEQVRGEKRKAGGSLIEAAATGAVKPWRDVITPHKDVASGDYQQAEFAADLWQVHLGEGSDEYRKPTEFFRRTYLTESLKRLLTGAMQRLAGKGGDPVIQLQTNFGGGKTHSMLALYHLFSGANAADLPGVDSLMPEAGVDSLPKANRVVLVGNRISPGNPVTKKDGTVVKTMWGELAYQLGGRKAFDRIAEDDKNATSPGDVLRELLKEHGPCLILIDEWVAYARQLHDQSDLPAGGFETQFTFAQALTESAKLAGNCLLVISLPASDTSGSPHAQVDDVEVGGIRGREALDRLRNVVGRLESSWRPATAEEGFEIVRRRLFEPLTADQYKNRDVTARAFSDLYHSQRQEFPSECGESDYENRIKAAYPIHPEIFDRLYNDWSTLVKFQRTRGVLRLMAAVIHSLWEKGDHSPMIMPSTIPIDDQRIQFELTRYLSDNWVPILEKDVDGPNSLPLKIDNELPNLGKVHAARRVARTIYLGSAPTSGGTHQGLDERRVNLGCVTPGESTPIFGDALRRLAASATYLYQDGTRYWYSTQPTVTKMAEDRREQLKRDPDKVAKELADRISANLVKKGEFRKIHPMPASGQDVADDLDTRLVVLSPDHPYSKEAGNQAQAAAQAILEYRGNSPRLYRNTLVFLAADKARLQDLEDGARNYLAWDSIIKDQTSLNLTPSQVKQAENQKKAAENTLDVRVPETYQWLLVPVQKDPHAAIEWQFMKLSGQDDLAVRASKKLLNDELLITSFAGTRLRMELDGGQHGVPLWPDGHISVKQLADHCARYLYLPRFADTSVLLGAIRNGVSLLTWRNESFAFADSYDEEKTRYRGLRSGCNISLDGSEPEAVVVKPEIAQQQMDAEQALLGSPTPASAQIQSTDTGSATEVHGGVPGSETPSVQPSQPKRFHGTIELNPTRVGRDAGQIGDEVIAHLSGLVGAKVRVTLEIDAEVESGVPDNVVRTVTENSRTLKFTNHGFESD